jgi:hypothetical protein
VVIAVQLRHDHCGDEEVNLTSNGEVDTALESGLDVAADLVVASVFVAHI